ncbi:MAG: protein kinase [bacterium]
MSTAKADQPETLFEAGTQVDHYKVLRLIGRGGMGEVYLARDTRLGRKVALKVVRPEAMTTPDARERFLFEARTTARFNHPHIVTIHDVGEHAGQPYVALEHLEGQALRERLQTEQVGLGEAIRIGRAVADALQEAHAHQIVHRDLKPGNVFLGSDGRLRVLDFGLARALATPGLALEETGASRDLREPAAEAPFETSGEGLRGTPAYMAPEQWHQQAAEAAADVWALGLILCELVFGAHPYRGLSVLGLRAQVISPQEVPIPDAYPGVPDPLVTLIRSCAAKDPADRPSAEQVADRLGSLMQSDRRVQSRRESPFRGLLPFDEQHGDQFFGRDEEIAAFVERLRGEPVLPVVGPSGAGKSSFVQAGVLPRLREQGRWLVLRVRPGAQPLRSLAQRLVTRDSTIGAGGSRGLRRPDDRGSPPASRAPVDGADPATEQTVSAHGTGGDTANDATIAADPDKLVSAETVIAESGTVTPPLRQSAPARSPQTSTEPSEEPPAVAAELERELRESPGRLALLLGALAEREQARVLLFVDALEELYSLVSDERERRTFMEAVCTGSDDAQGPVRVVFTLRDDFLGRLAEGVAIRRALSRVTVLRSPGPDALREILVRPVEDAGYRYEDDALVDEMVAEVRGEAAALPLLQFAGQQLWERRDRKRQLLTREAYRAVGGVAGALAQHADGVLDGLSPPQVKSARELLVRLVTAVGTRQVVPRGDLLDGLGHDAPDVLDRLIEARTVLSRKARSTEASENVCELVHESLIQRWDRLRRWVEESREEQTFLLEAGEAAALWIKRGRRDEEVWQGDALLEARRALDRCVGTAPEPVRRFVEAGNEKARRVVRRRRLLMAGGFVALALVAAVLAVQNREVKRQRNQSRVAHKRAEQQRQRAETGLRRARENWAEALREGAGAALSRKNFLEARARFRASVELQDSPLARTLWLRLRQQQIFWKQAAVDGACPARFSPDGRLLATCAERSKAIYFFDVDTRRIDRILRGPKTQMSSLAFSPTGRHLAAGTWNGSVWLWDLRGGTGFKLTGHSERVMDLDFSADGKRLATASRDRTVRIWNVGARTVERVLREHHDMVLGVRFHPDGRRLASAASVSDRAVRLWDISNGRLLKTLTGHESAVRSLDFSRDGRTLASGSYDKTIRLWDVQTGRSVRVLRGSEAAVISLAYGRDGQTLTSGGNGDDVRVWDVRTGQGIRRITGHDGAVRIAHHPTRNLLATKTRTTLRLWDLSVDPGIRTTPGESKERYFASLFSYDFRHLIFSGERQIRIHNVQTGRDRPVHTGHSDLILAISISRDSKLLVTAAIDGTARLWDFPAGTLRGVLVGHKHYDMALSRDRRYLFTRSIAGTSGGLWSLDPHRKLALLGHTAPIRSFAFSRDSRRLATGSFDKEIRLWSTSTGGLERVLKGHRGVVHDLAFSPQGDLLVSAGDDRRVLQWQVSTGRLLRELTDHSSAVRQLALSEDGRRLASLSRQELRLWDLPAGPGRRLAKLSGGTRFTDVAVHPQGRFVAAALSDGTLRIWQPDTGVERTLRGHSSAAVSVQFRGDGRQLGSFGENGAARLWDVATWRPVWRAPLFRRSTRELLSHRGWIPLGPTKPSAGPKRASWRDALASDATQASNTPDGSQLCFRTQDDHVQHWEVHADRRRFNRQVPGVAHALALPGGCLVRVRKGPAILLPAGGTPKTLVEKAQAIATSTDGRELLVASGGRIRTFGPTGDLRSTVRTTGELTAVASYGRRLLVGRVEGSIAIYTRASGASKVQSARSPVFAGVPSSPVVALTPGPLETVAAGFADGHVGMWSLRTGRRLLRFRLHGPVVHLSLLDHRLYAATSIGAHRVIPLPAFYQSYCQLLREVWQRIPVVWRGDGPVRRPPPAGHRCFKESSR